MIEATSAGGWKVRIDRPVAYARLDFYVYRHGNGHVDVMQPDSLCTRVREGELMGGIKPTFSLSGFDGKEMMLALAEALSEEGIRSPNDHAIRGQLEAQTAHLNDLRTLLKLNKTSGVSK